MSMSEKYDATFLGILQNEGQVARFLDAVFSFLFRRTDFFLVMPEPTAKMGFPPEVAKKMVLTLFNKYNELSKRAMQVPEKKPVKKPEAKQPETTSPDPVVEPPPVARHEEVVSSDSEQTTTDVVKEQPTATATENPTTETSTEHSTTTEQAQESHNTTSQADKPQTTQPEEAKSKTPEKKADGQKKENDDEDDELTSEQKAYQENPESYNGAIRDNYVWSQSINDLDVRVKIPSYIKRAKAVKVDIQRKHLTCSYQDDTGNWVTPVSDDLTWEINKEESMWSIVPGEHIHVNLEKVQERWWEAVLESEPHINVRKIDASRPITDLDDASQAKIEEMMYNENQKRMGLPQSHEKKVHNILKDAWDAEGSPFRGQPFDPSKINVSGDSGTMNFPNK